MSIPQDLTSRQQNLLVFIGSAGPRQLDPIRIMKGQFLVAMEAPKGWLAEDARYRFEPYNYGPFSSLVYADLDRLEQEGYISSAEVPGRNWKYYSLSPTGEKSAAQISAHMPVGLTNYIDSVREFVTSLSFNQLLKSVYRQYPDFAVKSVFAGKEDVTT